jgi:teichuronic acid biosynthesis glycosyltransferase TuaC
MLLLTPGASDPRVEREVRALTDAGYYTTVCAWGRGAIYPQKEGFSGGQIVRFGPRTSYGIGAKQLLRIPLFWFRAFWFGVHQRPDIVHCHDLDTAIVGIVLKTMGFTRRLVFDSHEVYPDFLGERVGWLVGPTRLFEKFMVRRADLLIVVSERMRDYFKVNSDVCILPNAPEVPNPLPEPIPRDELGIPEDSPIVLTVGSMDIRRGILEMIEATKRVGAFFVLAGRGGLELELRERIREWPHVRYLGQVPYHTAVALLRCADLAFYGQLHDRASMQLWVALLNTVRLSLATGTPLVISRSHGDSELVEKIGSGVVVDDNAVDTLESALREMLFDEEQQKQMSKVGLAASHKHRWTAIKSHLVDAYDSISLRGQRKTPMKDCWNGTKSRSMRIAVVSHYYPRPSTPELGQFVRDQVRFLARGYDVSVLASGPWFPPIRRFPRWYERSRPVPDPGDPGVRLYSRRYLVFPRSRYRWLSRLTHLISVGSALAALCRRKHVDIIHAHTLFPDGLTALIVAKFVGIPVVVTVHGSDAFVDHGWAFDRLPNRFVLSHADAIIAVSKSLADNLRRRYGSTKGLKVIENGIMLDRFSVRSKEECALACGLDSNKKRVVAVGAFSEVKGTDVLLAAWEHVASSIPAAELVLVGEPHLRHHHPWFVSMLRENKNRESIRLVGVVPNEKVADYIGASDLLVSASRREGFGVVLIEALACGRPVVATRCGGPEGIVEPDVGILVPPENSEAIAEAILLVLNGRVVFDPNHLARRARDRYNLTDRVAEIRQLYETCIRSHSH